jgi:hypothetical protein
MIFLLIQHHYFQAFPAFGCCFEGIFYTVQGEAMRYEFFRLDSFGAYEF